MKEAELLSMFGKTYEGKSTPVECAVELVDFKKMLIKLARIMPDTKPPLLEVYNVIYFVKDAGLETESVYLTPSISNPIAVSEIKAAAEAEAIKE